MKIGKLKKALRRKKHKRDLKEDKIFRKGELSGAIKEREKINQQIKIENKNNLALKELAEKQKTNATILEKNQIIQTMKDERDRLTQQFEDYKSLYSIQNKPLEEKVSDLKQELKYKRKELENTIQDWESMIDKTEDVLDQINYISEQFEPSFLDAIKKINTVMVIAGNIKDAARHLKSLKRKVRKNGAIKKIPAFKIK